MTSCRLAYSPRLSKLPSFIPLFFATQIQSTDIVALNPSTSVCRCLSHWILSVAAVASYPSTINMHCFSMGIRHSFHLSLNCTHNKPMSFIYLYRTPDMFWLKLYPHRIPPPPYCSGYRTNLRCKSLLPNHPRCIILSCMRPTSPILCPNYWCRRRKVIAKATTFTTAKVATVAIIFKHYLSWCQEGTLTWLNLGIAGNLPWEI